LKAKNGITPDFCQEIIQEIASSKGVNIKTPNMKSSFAKGYVSELNPVSNPSKRQRNA
jgi:hypothetical protein